MSSLSIYWERLGNEAGPLSQMKLILRCGTDNNLAYVNIGRLLDCKRNRTRSHPVTSQTFPWTRRFALLHKSLSSIAESVGYGLDAAFNSAFKRLTGQSPGRTRIPMEPTEEDRLAVSDFDTPSGRVRLLWGTGLPRDFEGILGGNFFEHHVVCLDDRRREIRAR
jgi:AraC-like DNA-binding protein